MHKLPTGLYDLLHTEKLHKRLEEEGLLDRAQWAEVDRDEIHHRVAIPLSREIAAFISESIAGHKAEHLTEALNEAFRSPEVLRAIMQEVRPHATNSLSQILPLSPLQGIATRPDTPLSISALLTGSSRSPALRTQLIKELSSCDKADWLVSFIRYAGILPLLPALKAFTSTPAPDGEPKLRIATTTYMGATEVKAIEALLALPNTEVRISYDTRRTRLHAKAYIFRRNSRFGSAYIGSANISKAALDEGLEWTAKISQYETAHLWEHAIATFESHWEDRGEFTPCDIEELKNALAQEQQGGSTDENEIPFFDLRPYGYQQVILDDIHNERNAGKQKHLVIAATGTGKTMVAAFDYKGFAKEHSGFPRILYVSHREEILKQARASFRQVMRDGSFGEILAGGSEPRSFEHLFCTVQSWNARKLDHLPPDYYAYVVLDEAHHAAADTYQHLIAHVRPLSLLGLTATPERSDGEDIRNDFGGAFTHEIRLAESIERALLAPFHYFGIPDLDGLDFSSLQWTRNGYDVSGLRHLVDNNSARAQWVMGQVDRYVSDIRKIRALGFCISVEHAVFMAKWCRDNSIPAIVLSANSPSELRHNAQRQLEAREINIIFTVDLFNEGVDIPSVDTVLFLRPTESLTVFLQQLGRGLRLHDEKPHLTVLDFIAPQHRKFSFARRFRALTSRPELSLIPQIESDMPYLPAGCFVHLEAQAKEHVINNINVATASLRESQLLQELRQLSAATKGKVGLQEIVNFLNIDSPDELYKRGLPHQLLATATGDTSMPAPDRFNDSLAKGFRRLLLMDDTNLIADGARMLIGASPVSQETPRLLHSMLWGKEKPGNGTLQDVEGYLRSHPALRHDLRELFNWLLENRSPLPEIRFPELTGPLCLHGSYSRAQVAHALGLGSFENPIPSREGLLHVHERKLDIFFADINKSAADFSPTTMYEDYAISDTRFHWQSQTRTSDSSPTGLRYINHRSEGYTPLLFIRNRKQAPNGLTAPYFFAGPLQYHSHEGSKPISIKWDLEQPLPARALEWARRTG
ncbi:DEAD/DEAH box helicase [Pelodictyon luteolum]|nr:DEAD/DEAH box helicase [Pelodictyon luteolum]